MKNRGFKFKNYLCFTEEYAGFDELRHINVVIGKNNSGKSRLLDLVRSLSDISRDNVQREDISDIKVVYYIRAEGDDIKVIFNNKASGGPLLGNHWEGWGRHIDALSLEYHPYHVSKEKVVQNLDVKLKHNATLKLHIHDKEKIARHLSEHRYIGMDGLQDKHIAMVSAERDIHIEDAQHIFKDNIRLGYFNNSGAGATNVIYNYLRRSTLDTNVINMLSDAFNQLTNPDYTLEALDVQQHDDGKWEMYLRGENGKAYPLSKSGSGIKTLLLVLLQLIVRPIAEQRKQSDYIYIFEELENNIHPTLLRRLLKYLEDFAVKHDTPMFLTTHSPVTLDVYAGSPHAQFVLVQHNGKYATTKTVSDHFERLDVVQELGCKASDLMLANGIIWVEGPSDRIYLNKWIELYSGGQFREGRDYQCAFFGGSLLAKTQCEAPESQDEIKVNIMTMNTNVILVTDGDRTSKTGKGAQLKEQVVKIKKQIEELSSSHVWVTKAKEIESYIPVPTLECVWNLKGLPAIGQYEPFFLAKGKGNRKPSYVYDKCKRESLDKIKLAQNVARCLNSVDQLEPLFDWKEHMEAICKTIAGWNQKEWPLRQELPEAANDVGD